MAQTAQHSTAHHQPHTCPPCHAPPTHKSSLPQTYLLLHAHVRAPLEHALVGHVGLANADCVDVAHGVAGIVVGVWDINWPDKIPQIIRVYGVCVVLLWGAHRQSCKKHTSTARNTAHSRWPGRQAGRTKDRGRRLWACGFFVGMQCLRLLACAHSQHHQRLSKAALPTPPPQKLTLPIVSRIPARSQHVCLSH